MAKQIAVKVNDLYFKNLASAAKYLNIKNISYLFKNKKQDEEILYKNNVIKKISNNEIRKENAKSRKSCKIICQTTGKIYPSIKAAAKDLNVSDWTISVKTQCAGRFIDKDGNVYVRERPMYKRSNHDYGNIKETLFNKNFIKSNINLIDNKSKNINKKEVNVKLFEVVDDLLKNKDFNNAIKVISLLKDLDNNK